MDSNISPTTFFDVLQNISVELSSSKIAKLHFIDLLDNDESIIFSLHPSLLISLSSIFKKKSVFLCWGEPNKNNVGFLKLFLIYIKYFSSVKFSNLILVNDHVTKESVSKFNKNIHTVPYVVDDKFYSYANYFKREKFVFVPGDNDRDEVLIQGLSRSGLSVVRVSKNNEVDLYYKSVKENNLIFKYKVTFQELLYYYQKCEAVVLPISTNNHAAGQTVVLEALSTGTPVVISKGRTSSLAESIGGVFVVNGNSTTEWLTAIKKCIKWGYKNKSTLKSISHCISNDHSPESVQKKIVDVIYTNILNI